MLFKYKGFNNIGKRVKGTVNASSSEEAGQKLRTQKIYYEFLTPSKEFSFEAFSKRQMPGEMLATFSKETLLLSQLRYDHFNRYQTT